MRKTFISNLILMLALNLLVKPFYILGIEVEIQTRVGPEEFGNYFALINFSFLLNILLDAGITNWNTRNIARQNDLVRTHFSHVFTLRLALVAFYLVACCLIGFLLGYSSAQFGIMLLLAFNQIIASAILYLRSNLSGLHLFQQDSVISVLDRILLILIMGYLLWFRGENASFDVRWLIWGQTAVYLVTFAFAFYMVLRKAGRFSFSWDRKFNREVLKQSFPFALMIMISMFVYRQDSVMLERMNGAEQAGIYAMGFRFFEAYNMISYLFAALLLPIFSGMLERKENPNQLVALSAKILFVGTWLFALIGILWNKQIMGFMYGTGQEEAADAYRWLMVGCIGFSMQYIYGTLLTARGDLKFLIRLMIVAVIVNLGLNLLLIPMYGAQGAAMSNAFTQCGLLVAEAVYCHRKFAFDLKKEYGRAALFSVLTLGVGILISQQPAINTMSLAYSVPLFAGFVALAALVTGMLDLKRFIQVIKQRSKAI